VALKLVKRAKSPYWYIRGAIRGINVEESTGLSDRHDAEDALALRHAELVRQSVHGHSAVRTFADAALSYMEAGGEPSHLAPLLRHFGATQLSAIGQHEIEQAARKLKPKAAAATRNRHVFTPMSAVLHHAAAKRWCDKPVLARPREPEGRVRWVTYKEAEGLIAAAGHLAPLVMFLFSTGARLSEALYIDWKQVDLERGQVSFLNRGAGGVGTKSGLSRGVPLHRRAVEALKLLPHREGAVFRRHYGGVRKDGKKRPVGEPYADRGGKGGGQVKTGWALMLKRAGLTDFTPHDCRHTWATWHYMANRDITALMQLGGWKSPAMVMRYAHVNTSHLSSTIDKLWGKSGNRKPAQAPKSRKERV
jgi:integrase